MSAAAMTAMADFDSKRIEPPGGRPWQDVRGITILAAQGGHGFVEFREFPLTWADEHRRLLSHSRPGSADHPLCAESDGRAAPRKRAHGAVQPAARAQRGGAFRAANRGHRR